MKNAEKMYKIMLKELQDYESTLSDDWTFRTQQIENITPGIDKTIYHNGSYIELSGKTQ